MACTCTQKKKEPAGGAGNFKYTFECKGGSKKEYVVIAANDNEAKALAKLECEEGLKKKQSR